MNWQRCKKIVIKETRKDPSVDELVNDLAEKEIVDNFPETPINKEIYFILKSSPSLNVGFFDKEKIKFISCENNIQTYSPDEIRAWTETL